MKVTVGQLRRIIKEEVSRVLSESGNRVWIWKTSDGEIQTSDEHPDKDPSFLLDPEAASSKRTVERGEWEEMKKEAMRIAAEKDLPVDVAMKAAFEQLQLNTAESHATKRGLPYTPSRAGGFAPYR